MSEVSRNVGDKRCREGKQFLQHPGAEGEQREANGDDLGNKGERHLLDLGDDLENADEQTHQHAQTQDRRSDEERGEQQLLHELQRKVWCHTSSPLRLTADARLLVRRKLEVYIQGKLYFLEVVCLGFFRGHLVVLQTIPARLCISLFRGHLVVFRLPRLRAGCAAFFGSLLTA